MDLENEDLDLQALLDQGQTVYTVAKETLDEQLMIIAQTKEALATQGASRETMLTLESFVEGSLPERYPANSFTRVPSTTNLNIAIESVFTATLNALKKFIDQILDFINKTVKTFIKFVQRRLGNDGDREVVDQEVEAARKELDDEFEQLVTDGKVSEFVPETAEVKSPDKRVTEAANQRYKLISDAMSELLIRIDEQKPDDDLMLDAVTQLNTVVSQASKSMDLLGDTLNAFRNARTMENMQAVVNSLEETPTTFDFSFYDGMFKLVRDEPVKQDEVFANTVRDLLKTMRETISEGYKTRSPETDAKVKAMVRARFELKGISPSARDFLIKGYDNFQAKTKETKRVGVVMKGQDAEYDALAKRYSQLVSTTLRKMQTTSMVTMNLYTIAILISDHMLQFSKAQQRFVRQTAQLAKSL